MGKIRFIELVRDWIIIAIGVVLAAHIVNGITYDSPWTLFVVVVLLSIFNIFLKPILVLITLPLIILSFGLLIWVINALLFMLAGWLVDGFFVASFSSALMGALIVSLVTIMANILFDRGGRGRGRRHYSHSDDEVRHSHKSKKDDVIDI